jgi:hypothetical protein
MASVPDLLLDNLRAFAMRVSGALGGEVIATPSITGVLSSAFDPFLNHLFAGGGVTASQIARALDGHPGFVWLAEDAVEGGGDLAAHGLMMALMHGMTATTRPIEQPSRPVCELVEVRSAGELDAWLEIYFEVFGADPRARDDWHRVHQALGSCGDDSLSLWLAAADGVPAATAAAAYQHDVAGLYCFTTREWARRRGPGFHASECRALRGEGARHPASRAPRNRLRPACL